MSDFTEIGKLPQTIFSGMPVDKLAPADPTKITDELLPLNNYKRNLIGGATDLLKSIPSMKSIVNLSSSTVKVVKKFSEKVELGNVLSKLPGLTESVTRNLLSTNTLINLQNADSVRDYVTIAGRVLAVTPESREMVDALDDIYRLTSDKNFFDRLTSNVQDSLIGVGIDIAGNYGYGHVATHMIDRLRYPKQKRYAWSQTFYSFAPSSDLDIMIQSIQEGGLANIYGLTPDPINHVLQSFRFNLEKYKTVEANTQKLFELLDMIDKEWYKYKIDGRVVYKLDHLKRLSQDAVIAFDTIDELRPVARGAMVIGSKSHRQVMKETYPILNELMK